MIINVIAGTCSMIGKGIATLRDPNTEPVEVHDEEGVDERHPPPEEEEGHETSIAGGWLNYVKS